MKLCSYLILHLLLPSVIFWLDGQCKHTAHQTVFLKHNVQLPRFHRVFYETAQSMRLPTFDSFYFTAETGSKFRFRRVLLMKLLLPWIQPGVTAIEPSGKLQQKQQEVLQLESPLPLKRAILTEIRFFSQYSQQDLNFSTRMTSPGKNYRLISQNLHNENK